MNLQFSIETTVSAIAFSLSLLTILVVVRRQHTPLAGHLLWLLGAIAFWLFTSVLEYGATDIGVKVLAVKAQYISIGLIPVFWFYFALHYTSTHLPPKLIRWLFIEPGLLLATVWTNEWHGLWWTATRPIHVNGFLYVTFDRSLLFGIHVIYSYLLLGAGAWMLIRFSHRAARLYRGQALLLVVAALLPWLGNLLYINGWGPTPFLDLTPSAFALSSVSLVIAIFYYRLNTLTPVHPLAILDSMTDGVVVLDQSDRIVHLNQQAARMMGISTSDGIGQPGCSLLTALPPGAQTSEIAHRTLDRVQ